MPDSSTLDTIIAGSWYLPATPEHRVGGKLYVQPDGTTLLEVAGALDDAAGAWKQSKSEALIHGIGTDGTFYSLFDNKLTSSRYGSPPEDKFRSFPDWSEYSQYVWHVSYYTHGSDFINDKSEISDVHVSLSVLQEWMAQEDQLESVSRERRESRLIIPQEREYVCDINGTSVILRDQFAASATRYEASIEYAPHFEIVGSSTTIEKVVSDWVLPVQRLMMFLSSYYVHITRIRLRRDNGEKSVELHIQMPHATIANPTTMFLFFYLQRAELEHMGLPLGDIVRNWFQLENDHPYLAELFGTLASNSYLYDDVILLLLFRAVEFFHAETIGSQKVSKKEHKERVGQTVAHIPSESDRKWVRDILANSNRKGLSAVMHESLAGCGKVGELILEHHPRFVRTAIEIRGKIAHTGRQDKEKQGDTAEVCVGLVWLVRRIVTERVFGSDEAADDYITNNWVFKSYLGEA